MSAADESTTSSPRFQWPPGPVDRSGEGSPQSPSDDQAFQRPVVPPPALTWWEKIERTWLGVRSPGLARRFYDASWEADVPSDYCPRCAETVGPFEADADGCPTCRAKRLPWERAVRLGSHEGVLREAVLDLKFRAWRKIGDDLGRRLGQAVQRDLTRAGIAAERVVVVPVPTTTLRRLGHGVDHALVLARAVARELGAPVRRPVRRRRGPAQRGASATERRKRVARAFRPRRGWVVSRIPAGSVVVVVDDVRTTGATLRAVCRAVRIVGRSSGGRQSAGGAGLRLWVATVGVTPSPTARRGSVS